MYERMTQQMVSTHSRPKAAGQAYAPFRRDLVFQHTAARRRLGLRFSAICTTQAFQHTAARRRLVSSTSCTHTNNQFQHTAARRRLVQTHIQAPSVFKVSTHSRPKAAGLWRYRFRIDGKVSTHSRPKAAGRVIHQSERPSLFQHTAARRRLANDIRRY